MTAVADIFDRDGDGYIDYYEFVAALHPNKDAYRPTTDADKIEDEVRKLLYLEHTLTVVVGQNGHISPVAYLLQGHYLESVWGSSFGGCCPRGCLAIELSLSVQMTSHSNESHLCGSSKVHKLTNSSWFIGIVLLRTDSSLRPGHPTSGSRGSGL